MTILPSVVHRASSCGNITNDVERRSSTVLVVDIECDEVPPSPSSMTSCHNADSRRESIEPEAAAGPGAVKESSNNCPNDIAAFIDNDAVLSPPDVDGERQSENSGEVTVLEQNAAVVVDDGEPEEETIGIVAVDGPVDTIETKALCSQIIESAFGEIMSSSYVAQIVDRALEQVTPGPVNEDLSMTTAASGAGTFDTDSSMENGESAAEVSGLANDRDDSVRNAECELDAERVNVALSNNDIETAAAVNSERHGALIDRNSDEPDDSEEQHIMKNDTIVRENSAADDDRDDVCCHGDVDSTQLLVHTVDVTSSDRGEFQVSTIRTPETFLTLSTTSRQRSTQTLPMTVTACRVLVTKTHPPIVTQRRQTVIGGGGSISPDDVDFEDEDGI